MAATRATPRMRTEKGRTEKGKCEGVPRRFWTKKEEECLLVSLEALYAEGIKLDSSLRSTYMIRLANMIGDMLPGCGIEEKHVKSKLTVWRRTHTAIVTILAASGGSGFSFDEDNYILVAKKPEAWSDQEKVYKEGVRLVRGKTFPWLSRWNVLFGTDRATGNTAVDVGDAFNDLQHVSSQTGNTHGRYNNDSNNPRSIYHVDIDEVGDDATSISPPSVDGAESRKSASKRRRSSTMDASQIKELMNELMESAQVTMNSPPAHLAPSASSSTPQPVNDIAAKQDGLYDALISLPDLSKEAVMWAVHHLANNHGDLRAFYGMLVDVRSTFVKSLMHFLN